LYFNLYPVAKQAKEHKHVVLTIKTESRNYTNGWRRKVHITI